MNADQVRAAEVIISAIREDCRRTLTATMAENHLKVIVVDALLREGYSLIEGGAGLKGHGRLISYSPEKGIQQKRHPLPAMPAREGSGKTRLSPDLRIAAPTTLVVELQARSQHGSQAMLFSANILDDFQRLLDRSADVFVLAADQPIYEVLRGNRTDRRGRKAKAAGIFNLVLPAVPEAPEGEVSVLNPSVGSLPFAHMVTTALSPAGVPQVIVATWLDETALNPEYAWAYRLFVQACSFAGLEWKLPWPVPEGTRPEGVPKPSFEQESPDGAGHRADDTGRSDRRTL